VTIKPGSGRASWLSRGAAQLEDSGASWSVEVSRVPWSG
jgi:hypothetical protein